MASNSNVSPSDTDDCPVSMVDILTDWPPSMVTSPKKFKSTQEKERKKNKRLSSHVTGAPCDCKRLNCFGKITLEEREAIINNFNAMTSKNKQDSYLASLISVENIERRRPRNVTPGERQRRYSYTYAVCVVRDEVSERIPVCTEAFLSIHGITNRRIQSIKHSLTTTGGPPIDKRGKHGHHWHKLSDNTKKVVCRHIGALQDLKMKYSSKEEPQAGLSISKLHKMYLALFPDNPVSYETYRTLFRKEISSGKFSEQAVSSGKISEQVTLTDKELVDKDSQSGDGDTRVQSDTDKECTGSSSVENVVMEAKKVASMNTTRSCDGDTQSQSDSDKECTGSSSVENVVMEAITVATTRSGDGDTHVQSDSDKECTGSSSVENIVMETEKVTSTNTTQSGDGDTHVQLDSKGEFTSSSSVENVAMETEKMDSTNKTQLCDGDTHIQSDADKECSDSSLVENVVMETEEVDSMNTTQSGDDDIHIRPESDEECTSDSSFENVVID